LGFYDIYGFNIFIEGSAESKFSTKYKQFEVSSAPDTVDLSVRIHDGKENLPTKPNGSSKGMWIPFFSDEKTLWYEEGVALNVLLAFMDGLIWWSHKVSLHAGGVAKGGNAFLFAGGGNVGKTSAVMNLLEKGYDYIGDDWLVIEENIAYPLWRTVHVHDYNLSDPRLARSVLGIKAPLYRSISWMSRAGMQLLPQRYLRYALSLLRDRLTINVDLQEIYPNAELARPTQISKVFYLERHNSREMTVTRGIPPEELARRMAYVYLYEWNFLFDEYYKYAYQYGKTNRQLEGRFDQIVRIARRAFQGADLYRVAIPENLDMKDLDLISKLELP